MSETTAPLIRLASDALEVVVATDTGTPSIVAWGVPGATEGVTDTSIRRSLIDRPVMHGAAPRPDLIPILPEHGAGYPGRPGILGARPGGRHWAPRFDLIETEVASDRLVAISVDPVAGLEARIEISVGPAMVIVAELINRADYRFRLEEMTLAVPLPDHLGEVITFGGRWAWEYQMFRRDWDHGVIATENRRGRTSHEQPPLIVAGSKGFGEWHGDVRALHLAWSGNHRMWAERLADGRRVVQFGELVFPGELVLEPGESYRSPEVIATASSSGLTPASWGFHRHLRTAGRTATRPRPVLINTWEAVYFDHDAERLRLLAERAASIGVERFVLDDGWFGSRRNDTSGLGDWQISEVAHPAGLQPLIDVVQGFGMEFGIWVEPEMVNPDSDTYRAHPEWALDDGREDPVLARNQLVLDLAQPAAFTHVFGALDQLFEDHDIAYVKWDMNRDLIGATGADGSAGSHRQTLAAEALWDGLSERHPEIEFESCASGGGRIDLRVLQRSVRVWASDNNDPLDRQRIQHWMSVLIPPEVMGAHIGPQRAHISGRVTSLGMRAITAMFGHLGLELDLTELDERELQRLAEVIDIHRRFRPLIHQGDTVRFDTEVPYLAHGVYAADRSEALISWAVLDTPAALVPPVLLLPGLDLDRHYRIERIALPDDGPGLVATAVAESDEPLVLTGRFLATSGFRPPPLLPATAALFHLSST